MFNVKLWRNTVCPTSVTTDYETKTELQFGPLACLVLRHRFCKYCVSFEPCFHVYIHYFYSSSSQFKWVISHFSHNCYWERGSGALNSGLWGYHDTYVVYHLTDFFYLEFVKPHRNSQKVSCTHHLFIHFNISFSNRQKVNRYIKSWRQFGKIETSSLFSLFLQ